MTPPAVVDGRGVDGLAFELPPGLEATEPPEERGLSRDAVKLLVAHRSDGAIEHRTFTDLPSILRPGDLLVVNTSATLPAALGARLPDGTAAAVHLSGCSPSGAWVLELRHLQGSATTPWLDAPAGMVLDLPGGAQARLFGAATGADTSPTRLWTATLAVPMPVLAYLARYGRPIRYGYVARDRPIGVYQTVFADHPGSAEMPSAARPFSAEVVTRLVARGVNFAPFVLHTGVSSPEAHEPPSTEWYRLAESSAALINATRAAGDRVIAVGTTAVRTIETVADESGRVHAAEGWTDLVIGPGRGVRAVDGLITGWHEPQASHLQLLEAVAGRPLLEASYTAALTRRYLWHEFGDSHLILR
ncbi:MAG: S-adenosylmethionine:tRNA ribosyltransferase-isomerase, partial [Actinomycetota bacterium]|nr:S-adenosylmethionine:tRNA ribosyltransferase-isomerase [Actinomycetota bacterium]